MHGNDKSVPIAKLRNKPRVLGVVVNGRSRAYPVSEVAKRRGGRLEDNLGGAAIVLEALDGETIKVIQAPESALLVHTFWFAWAAFHPNSEVFSGR